MVAVDLLLNPTLASTSMAYKYRFVFAQCRGYRGRKILDNRLRTMRFKLYAISDNIGRLSRPHMPWVPTFTASHKRLVSIDLIRADNDDCKVNLVINHAWSRSTLEKYDGYMREFFAFCCTRRIQTYMGFHASERLLYSFATFMAGSKAGGTASAKTSMLKAWHIQNDLLWMGSSRLKYTIKSTKNLQPLDSIQEKCLSVSLNMFLSFRDHLDLTLPEDACIWAIACTTFWSQICIGEFCPKTERDYDMDITPTWEWFGSPSSTGTRTLYLPRTKRGTLKGETVVVMWQHELNDPIAALENHALVNNCFRTATIAYFRNLSRLMVGMTVHCILKRLNGILANAQHFCITGHCFRIGRTTHLLLQGVPPDVIKLMGRWTSDAFLHY